MPRRVPDVARRKGEMSKSAVDSGWPHQVALPSPQMVVEFNAIMDFCKGLSLCACGIGSGATANTTWSSASR